MRGLFAKAFILYGLILSLASCSSGGSCNGCTPQQQGSTSNLSFSIAAPYEYPAGQPNPITIYATITNTSNLTATDVTYTVPAPGASGNSIGVAVDASDGDTACPTLTPGQACVLKVIVAANATPGSFTVLANGTAQSSNFVLRLWNKFKTKVGLKAVFQASANVNIGLVNIPANSNLLYILPQTQTVNVNNESATIVQFSVLVESGSFTSISLQGSNFTSQTQVSPVAASYANGDILTFNVTYPTGTKTNQSVSAITNSCTESCSNQATVNFTQAGAGILTISPSNANMSPSYTSQVYTLTNTGESNITGINLPAMSSEFNITSNCGNAPFSLTPSPQAGSSCTFTVTYTPGATYGSETFPIAYNNGLGTIESNSFTINYSVAANIFINSAILNPSESAGIGASESSFYIESGTVNQHLTLSYVNNGYTVATNFSVESVALSAGYLIESNTCQNATLESNAANSCSVRFMLNTATVRTQNLSLLNTSLKTQWTDASSSYTNQTTKWVNSANNNESQDTLYLKIFAPATVNAYLSSESNSYYAVESIAPESTFYLYYVVSGGYPGQTFSYSPTYNGVPIGICLLITGSTNTCFVPVDSGVTYGNNSIVFGTASNGVLPSPTNTQIYVNLLPAVLSLASSHITVTNTTVATVSFSLPDAQSRTFTFTPNGNVQFTNASCTIPAMAESCSVTLKGLVVSNTTIAASNESYSINTAPLAITPLFNYVASVDSGYESPTYQGPGNVFLCTTINTAESFSSCHISNGQSSTPIWSPLAMGFLQHSGNNFVYVASSSFYLESAPNGIYTCNVESTSGELANCTLTNGGATFNDSYSLGTNNGYIYVTDWYSSQNYGNIFLCTTSESGPINSCRVSNGGVESNAWNPDSIAFYKNKAYVASYNDSKIFKCGIGSDGGLESCAVTESSGDYVNLYAPTGITFYTASDNKTYAYIATWSSSGYITVCDVNDATGDLYSCSWDSSPYISYPEQLTVNGPYLYVGASYGGGSRGHGQVFRCPINSAGDLPYPASCPAMVNPAGYWYPAQITFNPFQNF